MSCKENKRVREREDSDAERKKNNKQGRTCGLFIAFLAGSLHKFSG